MVYFEAMRTALVHKFIRHIICGRFSLLSNILFYSWKVVAFWSEKVIMKIVFWQVRNMSFQTSKHHITYNEEDNGCMRKLVSITHWRIWREICKALWKYHENLPLRLACTYLKIINTKVERGNCNKQSLDNHQYSIHLALWVSELFQKDTRQYFDKAMILLQICTFYLLWIQHSNRSKYIARE